jgi:hypothetical protein
MRFQFCDLPSFSFCLRPGPRELDFTHPQEDPTDVQGEAGKLGSRRYAVAASKAHLSRI